MATQVQVTFDAKKPGALADFWAAALGYQAFKLPPKYVEWVESWGGNPAERKYEAWIVDPDRQGPTLYFQVVPEDKVVKNRVHLDLKAGDVVSEVERLVGLGAERVDVQGDPPHCVVMRDPEGNEFCVVTKIPMADGSVGDA